MEFRLLVSVKRFTSWISCFTCEAFAINLISSVQENFLGVIECDSTVSGLPGL